eukprot:m.313833 g.313833  ORF g.313833 m.313833 type:complete len:77 (+) comp438963_c0_seq1:17-247(+)
MRLADGMSSRLSPEPAAAGVCTVQPSFALSRGALAFRIDVGFLRVETVLLVCWRSLSLYAGGPSARSCSGSIARVK